MSDSSVKPERERAAFAATPPMTPDRWRTVDAILQRAVVCERDRRDAVVAEACGNDEALRREIASLLSAHDATPHDFLERPAVEALGVAAPDAPAPPRATVPVRDAPPPTRAATTARRMVSARVAVYAAAAALLAGLAGGWALSHWSLLDPWPRRTAAAWQPPGATAAVDADAANASNGGLSLVAVDRTGRVVRAIPANRPWTPRFSPDGHRVAYGAFGDGRNTSDVWVTELDAGTTRRLTDDDADSNDPQWSPDGSMLAYSVNAPGGKDIAERALEGGTPRMVATRKGTQFPSDWLRDGSALLVTEDAGPDRLDVLVQAGDGTPARPYAATRANEQAARVSPDGRWIAYTSDESGQAEVYLDSYSRPGRRVMLSRGGGVDPVWRRDGREIYYWRGDTLVAVQLGAATGGGPPTVSSESVLFRAPYQHGLNTMYDASPNGDRFVIVEHR